jgi:hypothetical protein
MADKAGNVNTYPIKPQFRKKFMPDKVCQCLRTDGRGIHS